MDSLVVSELKSMSNLEQIPILAAYATKDNKKALEDVAGTKINKYEWHKIRVHSLWPGPFKPVVKIIWHRQHIPTATIIRFLDFLEQPGYLQRVAFGVKVKSILFGAQYAEMDAALRLKMPARLQEIFY
jgi:hypothetical protein